MQIVLNVVKGPHCGKTFSFDRHQHFFVGRAKFAHFQLPEGDPYFSRMHFMIEFNPPECRLMDLGSTNGTLVNGQHAQVVDLHDGDVIEGGDTAISVSLLTPLEPVELPEVKSTPEIVSPKLGQIATTSPPAKTPKLPQIAGYEIDEEIGRGGMGVVHRAIRQIDQKVVAIKSIKPAVAGNKTDYERFLREVAVLSSLDHPGIIRFYDSGATGRLVYLVMEYFPGLDATKWLAEFDRELPIHVAVGLTCRVLDALSHAHDRGIVHRDVKPSNLLVRREGSRLRVKLADFGLAKVYQDSKLSGLTLTGALCGTPKFMSPEQILDSRCVKATADQYSAAATLYHFLTKQYTHDFNKPVQQVLHQILLQPIVPVSIRRPEIPEALANVVHQALAHEPEHRFGSVAEFREALRPFEKKGHGV